VLANPTETVDRDRIIPIDADGHNRLLVFALRTTEP